MADHQPVVDALTEIWPKVRDTTQAMINKAGGKRIAHFNRKIAEQTIWELQRAGRLLSPENTEVIERAKVWAESWDKDGDEPEKNVDPDEDVDLYAAVQKLAST